MGAQAVREVADGVFRVDVNHPRPQTTCCYLVVDGGEAALVDCGGGRRGAVAVMAGLEALRLEAGRVRWLLVTHAHLDHAGAAGQLMQMLPRAMFAAHPSALKHLVDPGRALEPASRALFGGTFFETYYGGLLPVPAGRARALEDGEELPVGGRGLRVLFTPGHAWHHVSFYDAAASFVAAGDAYGVSYRALDCEGVGLLVPVMPPSQFAPEAMRESVGRLHALAAAHMGLSHFDVLNTGRDGAVYFEMLTAALDDWLPHAEALFAEAREGFAARMKGYLLDWTCSRAVARGAARAVAEKLHENDSMLSAAGFEYYLKKQAAA